MVTLCAALLEWCLSLMDNAQNTETLFVRLLVPLYQHDGRISSEISLLWWMTCHCSWYIVDPAPVFHLPWGKNCSLNLTFEGKSFQAKNLRLVTDWNLLFSYYSVVSHFNSIYSHVSNHSDWQWPGLLIILLTTQTWLDLVQDLGLSSALLSG